MYHERIIPPNLNEIQDKFKRYLDLYDPVKHMDLIMIPADEREWFEDNVSTSISDHVGHKVNISYGFVTIMGPNVIGGIHIDGNSLDPPKDMNNWAVNIPIYNCSKGTMFWYDGDVRVSLKEAPDGVKYIQIENPDELHMVDSKIVNEPTLVRINRPHSASNESDGVRLLLSARFYPDLRPYDY